jgi:hypothetical protein
MLTSDNTIKTTIEFDADLYYAAKSKALQERLSIKAYLNGLVSRDLEEPTITSKASSRYDKLAKEIENGIGIIPIKNVADLMNKLDK